MAKSSKAWKCAACGRTFAKANQAHSCKVRSVDSHFSGKDPRLRATFDALCRALDGSGPFRIDAVQTSIHLVSVHHFGGVGVRRDHLRLAFLLDREIAHARIDKIERIGPNRFAHRLVIRTPADVDRQLIGWFAKSQAMQATRK